MQESSSLPTRAGSTPPSARLATECGKLPAPTLDEGLHVTQARSRPLMVLSLATMAALALASCGSATPSSGPDGSTSPSPTRSLVASPIASSPPVSPSPEPSPSPLTYAELLETGAPLDPAIVTAVCDPAPSQTNFEAGESTVFCTDGLDLGLRAIQTIAGGPIERLYLRRMPCPTNPCSADTLDTAVVTGWSSDGPVSVTIDSRLSTVTAPVADPSATWPPPGPVRVMPVKRPPIAGAPSEVSTRTPYPLCGIADMLGDANPGAFECFESAVLDERAAELLFHVFSTEGEPITWLYRYSGHGAVLRYESSSDSWLRQAGALVLGPVSAADWSFEPLGAPASLS
jgi:hypothetical protein